MGSVEKIAISVDRELLRRVEKLRDSSGESRSALVSRALAQLVADEERQQRIALYVDAYRRMPEQDAEVAQARKLARRTLAAMAWEEE